MKKVLCILTLLCAVFTGAWADLVDGSTIVLQSNYLTNDWLTIPANSGTSVKAAATESNIVFQLVSAQEGGFYLQEVLSGKYVGKTNGTSEVPSTADVNAAGRYTFNLRSGENIYAVTCQNPSGSTDHGSLHHSGANVTAWEGASTNAQGSWWNVTEVEPVFKIQNATTKDNRGYLAAWTSYTNGPSLADCNLSGHTSKHPASTADGVNTLFYMLRVGEKLCMFSLADAHGTTPKFLNASTSPTKWSETPYLLTIVRNTQTGSGWTYTVKTNTNTNTNTDITLNYNMIARADATNTVVSAACGTESVNGAVMTDTNTGDGGVPFRFYVQKDFAPTADQTTMINTAKALFDEGHSQEEISALQAKIDDVLDKVVFNKVIGYPYYSDNLTEISDLIQYSSDYTSQVTNANYDAALAALNVVYGLTNIVLPTPGKAYHMAFVGNNGTKKYIQTSGNAGEEASAAEFVCGKDGDKFIFVLKDGSKFMNYQGANTALASYNAEYNSFTIQPLATSGSTQLGSSTAADRFGYVYLTSAKRSSPSSYEGCMLVNESTGAYSNSTAPHFNGTFTSAITFEEVANDVYVKLSNPNDGGTSGLDGKYVGTFSAPYHVTLPADVKAYTAAISGTTVNFTELGTAVPANTGVLLYAESADADINENAVPVGTAAAAGANAFEAMIDGIINAGDYVLGNGTNGVGFYARINATEVKNKAYLPASVGAIRSFRFDFEEQTTGVESLQSEQTTGVAFDLVGRRINANAKGISIMNGKKYIK